MKSRFVVIRDEHSKLFGHRFLNSQLSLYLGLVQLMVCIWALSQHVWSIFTYDKILHCDFSVNSTLPPLVTHVDAIIFDIGLFHHLWGITGCVAQHLDGGYGRFCWCIFHTAALTTCLPFAFVSRPKPQWLWPLLIQQSAYGVGMLILSLAALPKAAHMLGDLQNAPLRAVAFYTLGTLMNFFLLYVYWHWYWHVESLWNSARRLRRGETLTKSERRPIRRATSSPLGGEHSLLGVGGQPTILERHLTIANGHLPTTAAATTMLANGGIVTCGSIVEKKQMSVTIVSGNHLLAAAAGTTAMPVSRIASEEQLNSKVVAAEHAQVNSTQSLPNGRPFLLKNNAENTRKMSNNHPDDNVAEAEDSSNGSWPKNGPSRGAAGEEDGRQRRTTPKLGTGNGSRVAAEQRQHSFDSNTSASTASTTTIPIAAATTTTARRQQQHQRTAEYLRPPPSPAPPPLLLAGDDGSLKSAAANSSERLLQKYSPEEALPPRVRHLRKLEGGGARPKVAQQKNGQQTGGKGSRKQSSSSAGSASSVESRKYSSESERKPSSSSVGVVVGSRQIYAPLNGFVVHQQQPLSARASMPVNGQLSNCFPQPSSSRQPRQNFHSVSLRQRRRLSMRQRNQQMAAGSKKTQQRQTADDQSQQHWVEMESAAAAVPLSCRQSLPIHQYLPPTSVSAAVGHRPPPTPPNLRTATAGTTGGFCWSNSVDGPPPPPAPATTTTMSTPAEAAGRWAPSNHCWSSKAAPPPPPLPLQMPRTALGTTTTPVVGNQQHCWTAKRPLDGPINSLPFPLSNGRAIRASGFASANGGGSGELYPRPVWTSPQLGRFTAGTRIV